MFQIQFTQLTLSFVPESNPVSTAVVVVVQYKYTL